MKKGFKVALCQVFHLDSHFTRLKQSVIELTISSGQRRWLKYETQLYLFLGSGIKWGGHHHAPRDVHNSIHKSPHAQVKSL